MVLASIPSLAGSNQPEMAQMSCRSLQEPRSSWAGGWGSGPGQVGAHSAPSEVPLHMGTCHFCSLYALSTGHQGSRRGQTQETLTWADICHMQLLTSPQLSSPTNYLEVAALQPTRLCLLHPGLAVTSEHVIRPPWLLTSSSQVFEHSKTLVQSPPLPSWVVQDPRGKGLGS